MRAWASPRAGARAGATSVRRSPRRRGRQPDLSVGQRVFHQKFGYGRIVAVDGNKLDIDFEKAGPKKVMDSFVEAA